MIEMIIYNQDANITNTPKATESGNGSVKTANKTKSVASTWKPFILNLTDVLNDMEQGQILTLQKSSPEEWIQFAPQGKSIRIECKSNFYREVHEQLTVDQVAALADIGWLSPTGSPEESTPSEDKFGSPNHFVDLLLPLKTKALSGLVVRTFTEVFSATHPEMLQYEAFEVTGDSLPLPDFGVKVAITCTDASQNPKLPQLLLDVLSELTGVRGWTFDDVGDVGPISFGNVKAFGRLVEQSPYIRFYCPVIHDIEENAAVLSKLNELNCIYGHAHFCLLNGAITCVSDVLVSPFHTSYVASGLANFLQVADELSGELIEGFSSQEIPAQQPLWH